MNRVIVVCAFLMLLLLTGCGEKEEAGVTEPTPALSSLVDAERAFAAQVYEKGVRGAFLANLSTNSVVFDPKPVNGQKLYQEHEDKPTLLEWEPIFADISRAGRMGYTTGPWKFRADSTEAEPSAFGHYISIWRRPPGGQWQVALDIGVTHAKPDTVAELTWPHGAAGQKAQVVVNYEAAQEALMGVDRELSEASQSNGFTEALLAVASEDIRLYRTGALPGLGKEVARTMLAEMTGALSWEPEAGSLARSGDLGYTYGTAELRAAAEDTAIQKMFSYVRIWKKGEDRRWKVVLDVALEQPMTEDEEGQ